jgi:acyl-CoA thioester hydrolase
VNGYEFVVPIQVRWRDVDALGHINNAAVVTYVETARTELWRERFGGGAAIPFVVARLEVDYRRQITLDDPVRVGLRVTDLRGARFTFEYRIEAGGALAAEVRTVMGHLRPGAQRPSRIPVDLREKLQALITKSSSEC